MKHIVNFSGGLGSFWAAHRVIQKEGTADVTLLFADVLVEDPCLYALLDKAAKVLGVPITRISKGLTPWELFRKEGAIGNSQHPICSYRLKRQPLDKWMRQNASKTDSVFYVGFDWNELHRLDKLRAAKPGWHIEAPMTEPPLWEKCTMRIEAEKLGLPKQDAYELGFPHNNCGKRCVAAGITHWVHLLQVQPAAFLEWEREEQITLTDLAARGIRGMTMLKDRRGGVVKSLSLLDLRLRVESGEQFPKHEWGGCGCGGAA